MVNGSNNVSGFGAVSAFSIGSNGALTPAPGSPFATGDGAISVAITPEVPFAASFAKLEIEARHRPGFELKEFFPWVPTLIGLTLSRKT
jgi:hypothetical protein